jgi:hypothetical protein
MKTFPRVALLALVLEACDGDRMKLEDAGDLQMGPGTYGVVVLAQSSVPIFEGFTCAMGPLGFSANKQTAGAMFSTLPITDNRSCPDGSVCCLSSTNFTYSTLGEPTTDGTVTFTVQFGGLYDDGGTTHEGPYSFVLQATDGSYPLLDSGLTPEVALNSFVQQQEVAMIDDGGTMPWAATTLFPFVPWSESYCAGFVNPLPRKQLTWSWGAGNFARVLLSMPYANYYGQDGGYVLCSALADAGSITIPSAIMEGMPPSGYALPLLIGTSETRIFTDAGWIDVIFENGARTAGDLRFYTD